MSAIQELTTLVEHVPPAPPISDAEREGRVGLPPGTELRGGEFVLGKEIGCGSFGLIYEAFESRVQQKLAIKEFFPIGYLRSEADWSLSEKPDQPNELELLRGQFKEEYRVLERFERPGIVKVYDLFEERGGLFLVMEQLQGATLDRVLSTHKHLGESPATEIIRQLARTLETIHLSGLVHGDIKPENLFLTFRNEVILLDFGAVNHYLTDDRDTPRFLTPGYAPPEQYQAHRAPDPASDIYAMGATFYELLTGTSPPDARDRLKGTRLPAPPSIGFPLSPEALAALARTLALAREKRPASAYSFLSMLPGGEAALHAKEVKNPLELGPALKGHNHSICSLQLSADGKFLASGDKHGHLRLWSMSESRCLGVISLQKEMTGTSVHPDGRWLAVALADGHVQLIDFTSGQNEGKIRQGNPPVHSLSFSPDGSLLGCGLSSGVLEIWDVKSRKRLDQIRAHNGPINQVTFNPSGRLIALASNDRSASIWDLKNRRRIRHFDDYRRPVQCLKFSPNGRFLLTGGSDLALRLFDIKKGDEFRKLKGHEAMVWDLLFIEDQDLVATCSADRTLRLWSTTTFREVAKLEMGEGWLCSLNYHPQTRTILAAGADGHIFRCTIAEELN